MHFCVRNRQIIDLRKGLRKYCWLNFESSKCLYQANPTKRWRRIARNAVACSGTLCVSDQVVALLYLLYPYHPAIQPWRHAWRQWMTQFIDIICNTYCASRLKLVRNINDGWGRPGSDLTVRADVKRTATTGLTVQRVLLQNKFYMCCFFTK